MTLHASKRYHGDDLNVDNSVLRVTKCGCPSLWCVCTSVVEQCLCFLIYFWSCLSALRSTHSRSACWQELGNEPVASSHQLDKLLTSLVSINSQFNGFASKKKKKKDSQESRSKYTDMFTKLPLGGNLV